MKYICIVGTKGVGKDTCATYLSDAFIEQSSGPISVATWALADSIKADLADIFGMDLAVFYDEALKECPCEKLYGKTPREVMQKFGTDFMQNVISKQFWLDELDRKLDNADIDIRIVTDVRFEHELEYYRQRDALVIFVRRETLFKDNHISEQGLYHLVQDDDVVVVNDGELDVLQDKAANICSGFLLTHKY